MIICINLIVSQSYKTILFNLVQSVLQVTQVVRVATLFYQVLQSI
jgi:hypothetical protein